MSHFHYIDANKAKDIHLLTIKHSGGGADGILDFGKIESVLMHIQNDDYYPTFVDKLTHLFFCVCNFHGFEDGNKRMAITLSAQFLLINGYLAVAQRFFRETENISYHVAAGNIDKDLLHEILECIINGTFDENEDVKFRYYTAISATETCDVVVEKNK